MRKDIALHLQAEGIFVKADFGRGAENVVDVEDVKADCIVFDVAFGEESLCGACENVLLFCCDG